MEREGVSEQHIDKLCDDVLNSLTNIIKKQIKDYEGKKELDLEIETHINFGKERSKIFVGRKENRKKIEDYLNTQNTKPLVIYGESGSGKSALISKAVQDLDPTFYDEHKLEDLYNYGLIVRFIGVTPESSNMPSLITSLCRQISRIYNKDDSNIPSEYNELIEDFSERLKFATTEKPLYIFIDALDQFSNSQKAHTFTWIPHELPNNTYLVFSTLEKHYPDLIKNNIPEQNTSEVKPLRKDEGTVILNSWLKSETVNRELTLKQRDEIITKFEIEGNALYLKLAFEEAKKWKSYTKVPDLNVDLHSMIQSMFKRITAPENHGEVLVSHSLGYLAASKNGLTEDEIIDVLSMDKEVFSLTEKFHKPTEKKLPVVLWSRLYFDLEPYLTEKIVNDDTINLLLP